MFATFMEVLDTTVVNVSLPHIAGSLSATIDEATWALTSYLVANAIILPMTGWLASMFGRKRLLMLSVVGFTAPSFLCGLAPTLGIADLLPHPAGRDRRRAAAAVAGGAARGVPAAGSRQGDGLLGPRHRRRADSRAGARRLADRQLQLALGLLHQHPGRHRVDRDDASCTSSIRRTCKRGVAEGRLLGHRHARGRHRRAADRARQGTAGGLVRVAARSLTLAIISAVTLVALDHPRAAHRRPDRRSARVQGAQLRRRRVPDDGRRLRALRQHGAAADHAADAARLSAAAGRHRDGAARHRVVLHDADHRHDDRPVRCAQAARRSA